MNAELERLLPDLAIFKYSIRNPARYDLQIDLVQCVLDRLIDLEKEVSLKRFDLCIRAVLSIFRATEVLKEYFHKKRSGLSRTLYISPEKIRKIVFGLAKPFDKRTSEVGIINSSFHSIVKRIEKFAMTNECTLCWERFQLLFDNMKIREVKSLKSEKRQRSGSTRQSTSATIGEASC